MNGIKPKHLELQVQGTRGAETFSITMTYDVVNGEVIAVTGMVGSDLLSDIVIDSDENREYCAAVDAIQNLVLGHAMAGVDVERPAYLEALEQSIWEAEDKYRPWRSWHRLEAE